MNAVSLSSKAIGVLQFHMHSEILIDSAIYSSSGTVQDYSGVLSQFFNFFTGNVVTDTSGLVWQFQSGLESSNA